MASLTKIMTATVVIDLMRQFACSQHAQAKAEVKILRPATELQGTSAFLLNGDKISIEHLMYGMMLPSGNDAALSLAVYFGQLMLTKGISDPNDEFVLLPKEIDLKLRFQLIRLAFDHQRSLILRWREAQKQQERRDETESTEGSSKTSSPVLRIRGKFDSLKKRRQREDLVNYWPSHGNSDSEDSDESLSNFVHPSNFYARIRKLQKSDKVQGLFAENFYFSGARERECTLEELFDLAVKHPKSFELPDPMYRDLPPLTSIDRERRRVTEGLLDVKMQNALKSFYEAMNDKAAELGMKNSNFATSHGGIFLPDNYSTAHDIAILAGHAMKKHEFFR